MILPATLHHLEPMVHLLGTLFALEHDFTPDPQRQRSALIHLLTHPHLGTLFIAEEEGQVVGMVSLLYTLSTATGGEVALLEDLIVSSPRRGIGTALLRHAIDHARARGITRISLLTDHDNHTAQHLYAREGFRPSSMQLWRWEHP